MAPGDPCARMPGFEDRWQSGGLARYCAERRALAPPPTVEMPLGFAPMLGIDGIFVAATAPKSIPAPAPPPTIAATPAPPRVAHVATTPPQRSEAVPPEATAKEAPAKAASASPPSAAPQAPAQTPGTPAKPRIINQADPAPYKSPRQEPPTTGLPEAPAPTAEAIPRFAANRPELQAAPQIGRALTSQDDTISVTLLGTIRNPSTAVAVAVGGLTILLIAAMAVIRRRERAQLAAAASRDFAAVSLHGHDGREKLPALQDIVSADARPHSPWPAQSQAASVPPSWGDTIPRTRMRPRLRSRRSSMVCA